LKFIFLIGGRFSLQNIGGWAHSDLSNKKSATRDRVPILSFVKLGSRDGGCN
jgi:hypothetical protein